MSDPQTPDWRAWAVATFANDEHGAAMPDHMLQSLIRAWRNDMSDKLYTAEQALVACQQERDEAQKQLRFARADVADESIALDDAVEQFEKDKADLRARIVALEARLAARTPAT